MFVCFGSLFNYCFNLFNKYRLTLIIYFLLSEFQQIVTLKKKMVHFIQVIKFMVTEFFIICIIQLMSMGSVVMFPLSFLIFSNLCSLPFCFI